MSLCLAISRDFSRKFELGIASFGEYAIMKKLALGLHTKARWSSG